MQFWHTGILTDDVDRTIDFLCSTSGSAREKWTVIEVEFPQSEMLTGNGGKLKAAFGRVGGVTVELLQPLDRFSFHANALRARGPGFHHNAYICEDNFDETISALTASGGRVVWEAQHGGEHVCYVEEQGGTAVLEIINCCPFMPEE